MQEIEPGEEEADAEAAEEFYGVAVGGLDGGRGGARGVETLGAALAESLSSRAKQKQSSGGQDRAEPMQGH